MLDLSLLVCDRTATVGGVVSLAVAVVMMCWPQLSVRAQIHAACRGARDLARLGLDTVERSGHAERCQRGLSCLSVVKA